MAPQYAALPAHMGAHFGASRHACIQGEMLQPDHPAQISLHTVSSGTPLFDERIEHA